MANPTNPTPPTPPVATQSMTSKVLKRLLALLIIVGIGLAWWNIHKVNTGSQNGANTPSATSTPAPQNTGVVTNQPSNNSYGLIVSRDPSKPGRAVGLWVIDQVPPKPDPAKIPDLIAAKPKGQTATQYKIGELRGWWPSISDKDSAIAIVNRTNDSPGRTYLLDGPTSTYYRIADPDQVKKDPRSIVPSMGDDIQLVEFMSPTSETVYVTIKH